MEGVCVEEVLVEKERVTGVLTDKGEVKCEVFVNCAGQVHYIHGTHRNLENFHCLKISVIIETTKLEYTNLFSHM